MVRPVTSETGLPSTLTAYGGSGCVSMAISSDGITLAAATDDYINVYPVCSIWVPCISLNIPTKICKVNFNLQFTACRNPDCLYRDVYEPYLKPSSRVVRKKFGRHRVIPQGTIQILNFFGERNEYLVGVGPFLLVIYDLTKMDPNPMITIDMRYFGEDAYSYPYVMQASFTVLNIYRNYMYNNKLLSCIDFVFSTRPYIPTYYKVFFNESEKWWFVDCTSTLPILPRDSLDEDVPYILYNHDGSKAFATDLKFYTNSNSLIEEARKKVSMEKHQYPYKLNIEIDQSKLNYNLVNGQTRLCYNGNVREEQQNSSTDSHEVKESSNSDNDQEKLESNSDSNEVNDSANVDNRNESGLNVCDHEAQESDNLHDDESQQNPTLDNEEPKLNHHPYEGEAVEEVKMDVDVTIKNPVTYPTTTNSTYENTENESEMYLNVPESKLVVDMRNNIGQSSESSSDESEAVSDSEPRSIIDTDMDGNMEISNAIENVDLDSYDSDKNMNNMDDMDETKSNASDPIYKENAFGYMEQSVVEAQGPYFFKLPDKAVYYPFCLLENRFVCSNERLNEYAKRVGDGVLSYKKEYMFSTFIPLASVVVFNVSLENIFYIKRGKIRHCEIMEPSVSILSDLVISAVGMKAHTLTSRSLGRLYTILFNDRFYVLKYTAPSVVSWHLEECTEEMKTDDDVDIDVKDVKEESATLGESKEEPDKILKAGKRYRIHKEYDSEEDSISVQFCHYDPVLKIRYTVACFDTSKGDGYLAMCTNYTSQWSLQLYSLSSQSGVDAIRLVLDASKCNGFTQLSWIPFSGKLFVISRLNGELYQLEPKTVRSWVGLIPNFSCIDKNIEFIEEEDTFDLLPTSRVSTPTANGGDDKTSKESSSRSVKNSNKVIRMYPFTDLGFSLVGNEWLKPKPKPVIAQLSAIYHCNDPEVHSLYKRLLLPSKSR